MRNIFLINEYQILAGRTINDKLTSEQQLNHALFEICGECGEIHSIYQKELQGHPIDMIHLKEEIGDLTWGIAELCTHYGWHMSEILGQNIEKLKLRYPEGFENRSVNRDL